MNAPVSNTTLADFIWKNADDLWGNFKQVDLGKIILPFTLLRRLECVLERSCGQGGRVRETVKAFKGKPVDIDVILRTQAGGHLPKTRNCDRHLKMAGAPGLFHRTSRLWGSTSQSAGASSDAKLYK